MWQGFDICGLSEHVWTLFWSAAVLLSSATADASWRISLLASASYLLEDGFYSDRSGGMN